MSAKQVYDVYLANKERVTDLLNSKAFDALSKNTTINLTYLKLALHDPAFI